MADEKPKRRAVYHVIMDTGEREQFATKPLMLRALEKIDTSTVEWIIKGHVYELKRETIDRLTVI